jgi:hypothetical protein
MSNDFARRELLKSSGLVVGASVLAPQLVFAELSKPALFFRRRFQALPSLSRQVEAASSVWAGEAWQDWVMNVRDGTAHDRSASLLGHNLWPSATQQRFGR